MIGMEYLIHSEISLWQVHNAGFLTTDQYREIARIITSLNAILLDKEMTDDKTRNATGDLFDAAGAGAPA